jgi:hypothetical protein
MTWAEIPAIGEMLSDEAGAAAAAPGGRSESGTEIEMWRSRDCGRYENPVKTVEHFESAGNTETSRQTAFVKIDALFSRAFTRKCRFINQLVQGGKLFGSATALCYSIVITYCIS